jgi:hypothetical protein
MRRLNDVYVGLNLHRYIVAQGLVCVGLLVSSKAFALYAAVAMVGLGMLAQNDPPEW